MGLFESLFGSKDPQRLYDQALELIDRENYSKAARLLEKTIQLDPDSASCHFTAGFCYSRMAGEKGVSESVGAQHLEKSAKSFQIAVELADEYGGLDNNQIGKACFGVGTYYQYKKDWENSIKYLERAISLCPKMLETQMLLSTSYHYKGNHKRALQLAEECLNKQPTNKRVQQHWKALCKKQGIEPYSMLPEKKKKEIYKDLKEEVDSVFFLGSSLMSDFASARLDPWGGFEKMEQSIEKSGKESEERAIATISSRYKITTFEVIHILNEGDKKKWPFRSVV